MGLMVYLPAQSRRSGYTSLPRHLRLRRFQVQQPRRPRPRTSYLKRPRLLKSNLSSRCPRYLPHFPKLRASARQTRRLHQAQRRQRAFYNRITRQLQQMPPQPPCSPNQQRRSSAPQVFLRRRNHQFSTSGLSRPLLREHPGFQPRASPSSRWLAISRQPALVRKSTGPYGVGWSSGNLKGCWFNITPYSTMLSKYHRRRAHRVVIPHRTGI